MPFPLTTVIATVAAGFLLSLVLAVVILFCNNLIPSNVYHYIRYASEDTSRFIDKSIVIIVTFLLDQFAAPLCCFSELRYPGFIVSI